MPNFLNYSPADILCQFLIDENVVSPIEVNEEWPGVVSQSINLPNEHVAFYDTTGSLEGRDMETGSYASFPGVQILVKGRNTPQVWEKMTAIREALELQRNEVVEMSSGNRFTLLNCSLRTLPVSLGTDLGLGSKGKEQRIVLVVNYQVTIKALEE